MTYQLLGLAANGLWQGSLIAVLTLAGLRLTRRMNAATRHSVLAAALLIVAVSPGVQLVAPVIAGNVAGSLPDAPGRLDTSVARPPAAEEDRAGPSGGPILRLTPLVSRTLLIAWGVISCIFLVRLLASVLGLRALVRRARPLDPDIRARLTILRGPATRARFLQSADIAGPVTIGLGWRVILLPERLARKMSDTELAHVVAHEQAHLERRDDWIDLAHRGIAAIWFFHPAIYLLGRRLRLESELACDEHAMAQGGANRTWYAAFLWRLAEGRIAGNDGVGASAGALPMACHLGARVQALLQRPESGHPSARKARVAFMAIALFLTAAWLAPVSAITLTGGKVPPGSPVSLVAGLSSSDPASRARTAYRLGQLRAAALPTVPALLQLLDDDVRVPRVSGASSRPWGRPGEERHTTTPSEEAIKAILHVGRPALPLLEEAVLARSWPPDHLAVWALRLLRDFD